MIKPFGNNVLLQKVTEQLVNGIYLRDTNFSYVVYSVSDDSKLKVGQKVYINVEPEKLELKDITLYVTSEENILAYEEE